MTMKRPSLATGIGEYFLPSIPLSLVIDDEQIELGLNPHIPVRCATVALLSSA